jgi:hypothetical protein
MMSSNPEPISQKLIGAFCLLLVAGMIAPPIARASCGHYVTSSKSPSRQASLSGLELLNSSTSQADDPVAGIPQRKLPCAGPFCSSQEQNMPHRPASSTLPRTEAWSRDIRVPSQTAERCDYNSADLAVLHTRHGTFPVERPPRLHASL